VNCGMYVKGKDEKGRMRPLLLKFYHYCVYGKCLEYRGKCIYLSSRKGCAMEMI
jgi:hypothetical protein